MSLEGKKAYKVFLSEKEADYVKAHIMSKKGEGGFSALLDTVVINLYKTMKESGIEQGRKITWAKVIKMFFNGIKQKV
jgi:hypothetical protein